MAKIDFTKKLATATTENQVRDAFARHYNIDFKDENRNDLSTDTTLFEFKFDKNMKSSKILATIMAQAMYYIYRAKLIRK